MENLIGRTVKIKNLKWLYADYRNQYAKIISVIEGEYYMDFPPDIPFDREHFTLRRIK